MEIVLEQEIYDSITATCMDIYREQENVCVDEALMRLMDLPGVPMHYPYHHYIFPAALLTLAAVIEQTPEDTLSKQLSQAKQRSKAVLGGFCGNYGACGAAVGAGIFFSIHTGASPKKRDHWAETNEITGQCLLKIAEHPGPRCCKRTLFLSAQAVCRFCSEHGGPAFRTNPQIRCHYSSKNTECLKEECPFYTGPQIE